MEGEPSLDAFATQDVIHDVADAIESWTRECFNNGAAVTPWFQDGIWTDGTEKGRETPVTNGHSRSPTVTRKPGLASNVSL